MSQYTLFNTVDYQLPEAIATPEDIELKKQRDRLAKAIKREEYLTTGQGRHLYYHYHAQELRRAKFRIVDAQKRIDALMNGKGFDTAKINKRTERAQHVNDLLKLISKRKPGHFAQSRFEIDHNGQVFYCKGDIKASTHKYEWPGCGATFRQFGRHLCYYIMNGKQLAYNSSLLEMVTDEPAELLNDIAGSPVIDWGVK